MGIKELKDSKSHEISTISTQILNSVKRILKGDSRGFEKEKLFLFFMSLGSYRNSIFVFILRDSIVRNVTNIINSIFSLHPENYIYTNNETGTKCRKALIFRSWSNEKNLNLMNFEKNKDLIRRFLYNKWKFTESLRVNKSSEPIIKDYNLPHMNVFCSTTLEKISKEFENGAFLLDFKHTRSQSRERSQYRSYESHNYQVMAGINEKIEECRIEVKKFLSDLNTNAIIDIPYEKLVRKYFRYDLSKNELYHTVFLELIKNITFFHQYERDHYILNETGKKVIIAEYQDLELAFEIGVDIFSELSSNFNKKQADFFNFLIKNIPEDEDYIDNTLISGSDVIDEYRSYLERKNKIPMTPRQYRNYLKIFVNKGYLKHKKENNLNYYWIKHAPSLKTLNLKKERTKAEDYISRQKRALGKNELIEFCHNYKNNGE